MSGGSDNFDIEEQLARIARAREEALKYTDEQHKLMAEARKFDAEQRKLDSEQRKLDAEQRKLQRDRDLAPWQIVVTAMGTGAALFAAGAAFLKLLDR